MIAQGARRPSTFAFAGFAIVCSLVGAACSRPPQTPPIAKPGSQLPQVGQFSIDFPRRPGELVFADSFDDLGGPYRPEDDGNGSSVPSALFPDDGSRWTQIQNSHPGTNSMTYLEDLDAIQFFASGQAEDTASKMDLGRELGFGFVEGDVVHIGADIFVVDTGAGFTNNTIIDLEDTDDLTIDGELQGAGIRLRTNEHSELVIDRGELLGADEGEDPHFRLGSMRSDFTLPVGEWVRVEMIVRLGFAVPQSTIQPIDSSFDGLATGAWGEIWITLQGENEPTLVMRQKGTTFLDRSLGLTLIRTEAPEMVVVWPEELDYNSVQIGLTNNHSGASQVVVVDRVQVTGLRN